MAVAGHKSRLLVGDFHLAAHANSVSAPLSVDALETTRYTDAPNKTFIPGRQSSTFTVNGLYDTAAHTDLAAWQSAAQPVSFAMEGLAAGSFVWLVNAIETQFSTGGGIGEAVPFSLSAQTDGLVDFGLSLHDLGAETADGNGTSVDYGASSSGGAVAHLHVTAYSGLTSAAISIEDSADNSSWSAVSGGAFASVTAVGAERLVIAGTVRRYVRAIIDVTGTGSVTYQVSIARR